MDDAAAFDAVCQRRWPQTRGKPVCPRCSHPEHYFLAKRRRFKCRACHHQFSPTSGTLFSSSKISYDLILKVIDLVDTGNLNDVSALQFSRSAGIQYKSAWVLFNKIREAKRIGRCPLLCPKSEEWTGYWQGSHSRVV